MNKVSISVFVGPMFAGKTSRLVWELERIGHIHEGETVYITHASDEARASDKDRIVTSHSKCTLRGNNFSKSYRTHNLSKINVVDDELNGCVAIGVDEAQFFNADDLEETVKFWSLNIQSLKHIFVCGLDGDFEQKPFPNSGITRLLPISDTFEKLKTAVCLKCIKDGFGARHAPFTSRKWDAPAGHIGGAERWEAVCRKCLND